MRAAFTMTIALAAVAVPLDRAMAFPRSAAGAKAAAPTTRPKDPLKEMYGRVMQELDLPADKAPKVQKILDDNYKTLTEWVAKVNPEVDKLRAQMKVIHDSTNPKAIEQVKAAMARYRELQAEMKEIRTSVFEPLGKLLSAEQLAAAKTILLPQPKPKPRPRTPMPDNPFHLLAKVDLTKEQSSKIAKIMESRNAKEKDPAAKAEPMAALWDRIVKEVLTDEQRTQLEAARVEAAHRRMALAILGGLTLTAEQMDKVDAIWKEAYAAAAKKPAARIDIYSTALDKITDEVLTDAQRKQLKSGRGGAPHPMPPGAMGR